MGTVEEGRRPPENSRIYGFLHLTVTGHYVRTEADSMLQSTEN